MFLFYFYGDCLALFLEERTAKRGAAMCCYMSIFGPFIPTPLFPSHGQVSAGLIIPQVEEDVVTKIM